MKAEGQLQRNVVTGFTKTAMNVHGKIYKKNVFEHTLVCGSWKVQSAVDCLERHLFRKGFFERTKYASDTAIIGPIEAFLCDYCRQCAAYPPPRDDKNVISFSSGLF